MPQQLVVTAIGSDRTGIVSKIVRLVTDCQCNIIDSRMAIFGAEFTFIVLISGELSGINRVEHLLPSLGVELDLTTMTKRTSAHQNKPIAAHYVLDYNGPNKVGTLGCITGFLASRAVYIGSLQSAVRVDKQTGLEKTHTVMTLELPTSEASENIITDLMTLLEQMNLMGTVQAQT
jgi:glycine cleavage system transcriptional repressor